ncbi:MAG TPA: hypothetical protein VGK49_05210, partial [Ilumatobacteraceae bacterium]
MSARSRRGAAAGAAVAAAAVAVLGTVVATTAQGAPAQRSGALELALVEQQFVVAPNGTFRLEYTVTGTLA